MTLRLVADNAETVERIVTALERSILIGLHGVVLEEIAQAVLVALDGEVTAGALIDALKDHAAVYGFRRTALGTPMIEFGFDTEVWDFEGGGH